MADTTSATARTTRAPSADETTRTTARTAEPSRTAAPTTHEKFMPVTVPVALRNHQTALAEVANATKAPSLDDGGGRYVGVPRPSSPPACLRLAPNL